MTSGSSKRRYQENNEFRRDIDLPVDGNHIMNFMRNPLYGLYDLTQRKAIGVRSSEKMISCSFPAISVLSQDYCGTTLWGIGYVEQATVALHLGI